jgi:hypothetical protein
VWERARIERFGKGVEGSGFDSPPSHLRADLVKGALFVLHAAGGIAWDRAEDGDGDRDRDGDGDAVEYVNVDLVVMKMTMTMRKEKNVAASRGLSEFIQ